MFYIYQYAMRYNINPLAHFLLGIIFLWSSFIWHIGQEVSWLTVFLVVWLWYIALNEALKKEVERLKFATGEIMTPTDSYNLGIQHIPYNHSPLVSPRPRPGSVDALNIQIPQFHPLQSNLSPRQPGIAASHSHALSEMLPQDPLRWLQGFDISSRSSVLVRSECPSISASEDSSLWRNFADIQLTPTLFLGLFILHRLTILTTKCIFHLMLIL